MGFFEDHESADFERDFSVRDRGCVEAVCATAHVNDFSMGGVPYPQHIVRSQL
jgi:hypothetical protein